MFHNQCGYDIAFDVFTTFRTFTGSAILQFYVLIGLVTSLWGLSFPTMKIGLNVMQPFTFLLFRSLVSSITIFSMILIRQGALRPPKGRPEFWWNIILHNLMFISLYYGAAITTSGRASVFLYTQPLFYAALAVWFIP
jgi:drug/metabolite transporter (DMT)-like permease